MQKNWYIVYTKPNYEKKIVSLFNRRKIENFCPVNYRKIKSLRRSKTLREPLFKSYVFVNIIPAEIALVTQVAGIISLLYWRNEPAVIRQDEIDAIKEFIACHKNIELARIPVNMHDAARAVDNTSYSMEGNVFTVKNKAIKVSLPSLGYMLIAITEDGSFFRSEVPYQVIRPGIHSGIQQ